MARPTCARESRAAATTTVRPAKCRPRSRAAAMGRATRPVLAPGGVCVAVAVRVGGERFALLPRPAPAVRGRRAGGDTLGDAAKDGLGCGMPRGAGTGVAD